MKLSEFMTCWRECVPAEFPIDLEQLKVNDLIFIMSDRIVYLILGICNHG